MKKTSLFIILMASSILSAQAMHEDVNNDNNRAPLGRVQAAHDALALQKQIQERMRLTSAIIAEHSSTDVKVILMGLSGAGKSTLLNCLAERDLVADESCRLDATNAILGSEIGHDASKTDFLSAWVGPNDTIYWDTAGDDGTEGPTRSIISAYERHQLLKGNVKLLLAVSEITLSERPTQFLRRLKYMTDILPVEELKHSMALVITKQGMVRGISTQSRLQDILKPGTAQALHLLTPSVRALLQHLLDNKDTAISYFPFPNNPGAYDATKPREKILASINSLRPMTNPVVQLQISPESQQVVLHLARDLKVEIDGSIRQKIRVGALGKLFSQVSDLDTPGSREGFATNLRALAMIHSTLEAATAETIGDFANHLSTFFEAGALEELKENLKALSFLATLNGNIDLNIWKAPWSSDAKHTLDLVNGNIESKVKSINGSINQGLEVINRKIGQECTNIINTQDDEVRRIGLLREHFNGVTTARSALREDLMAFAAPFNRFFAAHSPNPLPKALETLLYFQTVMPTLQFPIVEWNDALQPTADNIAGLILSQERNVALKQQERAAREGIEARLAQAEQLRIADAARIEQLEQQRTTDLAEFKRLDRERDDALARQAATDAVRQAKIDELTQGRATLENRLAETERLEREHAAELARQAAKEATRVAEIEELKRGRVADAAVIVVEKGKTAVLENGLNAALVKINAIEQKRRDQPKIVPAPKPPAPVPAKKVPTKPGDAKKIAKKIPPQTVVVNRYARKGK